MKRVVITGLGIVASNAIGKNNFIEALKSGKSGIIKVPEMEKMGLNCQIAGIPDINRSKYDQVLSPYNVLGYSSAIDYSLLAGLEAWEDAGFLIPENYNSSTDYNTGCILGSTIGTADIWSEVIIPMVDQRKHMRMGSYAFERISSNSPPALLSGILGIGNQNTSNSSACSSGLESIIMGYDRIKSGKAIRMLVGGVEGFSLNFWATMDAMRIINTKSNENPALASRPLSASASGFVPAAGAGILHIEEYESAINRKARIYGEIIGGNTNGGGQRNGGTMTASNPEGVVFCITNTLKEANISVDKIDLISGHLTSTKADVAEVRNWKNALQVSSGEFPLINAPKSLLGHGIGAAGAIETIACALQLQQGFVHPCINCEDVHPEIEKLIDSKKIPHKTIEMELNYIIKASFGFGDVNSCIILKNCNT
jgi:3-oxoacyl-[acyl-carrier-protein] synthase I